MPYSNKREKIVPLPSMNQWSNLNESIMCFQRLSNVRSFFLFHAYWVKDHQTQLQHCSYTVVKTFRLETGREFPQYDEKSKLFGTKTPIIIQWCKKDLSHINRKKIILPLSRQKVSFFFSTVQLNEKCNIFLNTSIIIRYSFLALW